MRQRSREITLNESTAECSYVVLCPASLQTRRDQLHFISVDRAQVQKRERKVQINFLRKATLWMRNVQFVHRQLRFSKIEKPTSDLLKI